MLSGRYGKIFFHTGDAQIKINLVVIGRNIAVADGPILAIAVAGLRLEIVIGEPQSKPPQIFVFPPRQRARTQA